MFSQITKHIRDSSLRYDKYFSRLNTLLLIASVLCFGYLIIINTENIFRSQDDLNFFVRQFGRKYLEINSIPDFFDFMVTMGNWPHPKIFGRIQSIISYHILGEINFRYIVLTGNFFILVLFGLIWRVEKIDLKHIISFGLVILLAISHCNFWPILISAYALNLICAYLCLVTFKSEKFWNSGFLSMFATLSTGLGIVFPFLNVFQLNRLNWKKLKSLLPYLLFMILNLWLFKEIIYDTRSSGVTGGEVGSFSIGYVVAKLTYLANFLFRYISVPLAGKNSGILSSFLLMVYLPLIIYWFFNQSKFKKNHLIYITFYWLISGLLAAFLRSDNNLEYFESPPLRYQIHSSFFVGFNILFLSINFLKTHFRSFILNLFIVGVSIGNFAIFHTPNLIQSDKRISNYFIALSNDTKMAKSKYRLLQYGVRKDIYYPNVEDLLHDLEKVQDNVVHKEITDYQVSIKKSDFITNVEYNSNSNQYNDPRSTYLQVNLMNETKFILPLESNKTSKNYKRLSRKMHKLEFYLENETFAKVDTNSLKLVTLNQ